MRHSPRLTNAEMAVVLWEIFGYIPGWWTDPVAYYWLLDDGNTG